MLARNRPAYPLCRPDHAVLLQAVTKSVYWIGMVWLFQIPFQLYNLYYMDSVTLEIELLGLVFFKVWPAFYVLRQIVWRHRLYGRYLNCVSSLLCVLFGLTPASLIFAAMFGRATCETVRWPRNESAFQSLGTQVFSARYFAGPLGPLTFCIFLVMCQGLLTYLSVMHPQNTKRQSISLLCVYTALM